jgi:hypothetical protein
MSIQIEFCPDLALREFSKVQEEKRKPEECLPENLEEEKEYNFLKKGQRAYWLNGELPLLITKGNQQLSKPIASITIFEVKHFKRDNEIWTSGKYKVIKKIAKGEIYFNGYEPIK